MAQTNTNLHAAKNAKNDEFYTQYNDISEEIKHYKRHFQGKVVFCNCDDPESSNFWRYFHNNFRSLGLKKLIATHYAPGYEVSYAKIYEGGDDFNMEAGLTIDIYGNDDYAPGDFRSNDSIRLLEQADIVVTNPPFSLFRIYVAQLMEYEKKFIIWGNNNAITYKEFFPLVKENKVWLGYLANKTCYFQLSDDYEKWDEKYTKQKNDGHKYGKVPAISTFTNLDIDKRHDGLWHLNGKFDDTRAHYHYKGFEDKYPKYDNYDAINIDKVKDIPIDYVPCWFNCDKADTCEYAIKNQNIGAVSVDKTINSDNAEKAQDASTGCKHRMPI